MKKILALTLAICAALTLLAACGNDNNQETSDTFITEVHDRIKAHYGEGYLPSVEIDEDMLLKKYGLDMARTKEMLAEETALSHNSDVFIGCKAKSSGDADILEEQLRAYHKSMSEKADRENQKVKLEAAQVVRHGEYVFYLCLAKDTSEDWMERDAENVKGHMSDAIAIIDEVFKETF